MTDEQFTITEISPCEVSCGIRLDVGSQTPEQQRLERSAEGIRKKLMGLCNRAFDVTWHDPDGMNPWLRDTGATIAGNVVDGLGSHGQIYGTQGEIIGFYERLEVPKQEAVTTRVRRIRVFILDRFAEIDNRPS